MKRCRTLVFNLLFVLIGLSLMLGSPGEVNAAEGSSSLTESEWKDVACYIDRYIQSQYVAGPDTLGLLDGDNEYGFIHTPAQYKAQVNSDGDSTVCDIGDNMANRPVFVDNLIANTTLIPGTSIRNLYNSASATIGALSPAVLTALKAKVNAHREAGFSTDISIY